MTVRAHQTMFATSRPSPNRHIQPFANSPNLPRHIQPVAKLPDPRLSPNTNPSSINTSRYAPLPHTLPTASLRFIGRYASLREIALPSSAMCCKAHQCNPSSSNQVANNISNKMTRTRNKAKGIVKGVVGWPSGQSGETCCPPKVRWGHTKIHTIFPGMLGM